MTFSGSFLKQDIGCFSCPIEGNAVRCSEGFTYWCPSLQAVCRPRVDAFVIEFKPGSAVIGLQIRTSFPVIARWPLIYRRATPEGLLHQKPDHTNPGHCQSKYQCWTDPNRNRPFSLETTTHGRRRPHFPARDR